jgi:hypothetical protein
MKVSHLQLPTRSELVSLRSLGLFGVCVLAFSLPFEMERPLLAIGAFRLTNVELLLFFNLFLALLVMLK